MRFLNLRYIAKSVCTAARCLVVFIFVAIIFNGQVVAQEPKTQISAQPYPVSDLEIVREDLTSRTFLLHIKNLQVIPKINSRVHSHMLYVAGGRGRTPSVEIEAAEYTFLNDGAETTTTEEVPSQVRQNLARTADLGLLRQFWVYTLTLTTMSPQGNTDYWALKNATLKIDIGDAPVTGNFDPARWEGHFGEQALQSSLLVNPEIPVEYYAADNTDPVEAWQSWTNLVSEAASKGALYSFKVFGGGLYRLSSDEINQITSGTVSTSASEWRIYQDGKQVPLLSDPANPDNAVYLPVASNETDGLTETAYWLDTRDLGSGEAPLRLQRKDQPTSVSDALEVASGKFTVQHREFADYNPKLKAGPGNDRWYWAGVEVDAPANIEFEMPAHFAPHPDSTVKTTVRYGFTNFPPVQPALLLYASGHDAVGTTLTTQQGAITLELPSGMLSPGKNTMAMRLSYPNAPGPRHPVVVQDIVMEWQQPLTLSNANYTFNPAVMSSTAPLNLNFAGDKSRDFQVLGFKGPDVSLLQGHQVHVPADHASSSFQYIQFNNADTVYGLAQFANSIRLDEINSAESVIITAPELLAGAEAIKRNQEQRGFDVSLFTSDHLYNVFSYGNRNPAAIRSALRYMFYHSAGSPPEYVTLVGEASDFQGDPRLVPPQVQLDMIPSSALLTPESPQGDHQYAAAIGTDQIADFILGRISASEVSQVLDYAAKSLEYENGLGGDWSRSTEFVMDDNDEFPDVVGRITANGMAPTVQTNLLRQWDYEYVPNLRVQGKKRSWTATQALLDRFNEGIGVLNFFGHGGPNLWSHERLLHLSDMPLITNSSMLPLITCASCDNAWITYPMPPVKGSMGELMVTKRDGGAIGLFGPVSGASPYEHSTLVQSLMEGITREQIRRIGDAIFYAKNRYYGITRSASIPEQYLLLGDPTVELKMPRVAPDLDVVQEELRAGEDEIVTVALGSPDAIASTGVLSLRTSSGSELSSLSVTSKNQQWDIPVPDYFTGGALFVQLESYRGTDLQISGAAVRMLPQLESALPPEITLLDIVGDSYKIYPVAANVESNGNATSTYQFSITSIAGTTEPVKIVAFHRDEKVGELFSVEPGINDGENVFDITANIPPGGETSSVLNLKVYPPDTDTNAVPLVNANFSVPVKTAAELRFVPGSGRVYSQTGEFVSHATVFMEGLIENTGQRTAENFTLQALRDDPATGTELQTINESTGVKIDRIEPGESRKVIFRWENAARGPAENVFLVANRNKVVQEYDYTNNQLKLPPFEVKSSGNFFFREFSVTPEYLIPGTTVTVSAQIENDFPIIDRPVLVEVGWERSFDNATTSTRFPVTLKDGMATFSKEIMAPENYTHVYSKVNANLEIEESDPGDNTTHTANMIVYDMPEFDGVYPLGDSFSWGAAYNFDIPFDGQLQVATEFSSSTSLLIVDQKNVVQGEAVPFDNPSDNKWWVALWRVAAGQDEDPGELGLRLPLSTVIHDVPGRLTGYFLPYEAAQIPVEVRLRGSTQWITPKPFGSFGNRTILQFGSLKTDKTAIEWEMRKAGEAGFALEYLKFAPEAAQWDSPPYLLPESLRSQPLMVQLELGNQSKWESIYVDRRSGKRNESGGISWDKWSSAFNSIDVPVYAEEYLQIRLLGIPKSGEYPYIENVRIGRQ